MTARPKLKISVSLDADVVEVVDHAAETEGSTRSAVMERWLRHVSRQAKLARLEKETAAYYDELTAAERDEDAAWAAAASRAARKLSIEAPLRQGPRRPRRGSPRSVG
jgi:metal-responsive CopG/Arc/MetJ family transcriptional regulator